MAHRCIKISVEGNIATGKSTFIEFLKTVNPTAWHVVPEPVSEWTKIPDSEKVVKEDVVKSPMKSPIRSPQKNRSQNSTPMKNLNKLKSPIRVRLEDKMDTTTSSSSTSSSSKPKTTETEKRDNYKTSGGKSVIGNCNDEEDNDENAAISCASAANLLELFYKDTERWSYTFQSYAILSRMRLQKRPPPKTIRNAKHPVMFYERSLYTDRYIFARNCWETELMTDLEFDIYSDWSDYLLDTQGDVHIHGVIYLRADPEVSHKRLNKRSRVEEKGITLEYLNQLHNKHEAWLHTKSVEKHASLYDVPILEIDCNKDFESDAEHRASLFERVKTFIAECHKDQIRRRMTQMEEDKENVMGSKKAKLSFDENSTENSISEKIQELPFDKNIEPVFGPAGDEKKPLAEKN